jgi:thiamine-monophosphate kinase
VSRNVPEEQLVRPQQPDEVTVAELGEFGLIRQMTTGRVQPLSTLLGPGDDAAVVSVPDGRVVAATDVLVQDVHFRLDWSTPEQVGRKAIAANLADIAAMGAVPTSLLVGLGAPAGTSAAVVKALTDGMWREASEVRAGIVGGDMVNADRIVVSVTVLGNLQGRDPVTRAGARPGDVIAVCGRLGWAAAGLAVLSRGFRSPAVVVNAHRVPEPPYHAGPQAAVSGATAMIDISDGLLADLGHLAAASGVVIDVRSANLPVHQRLLDVSSALGADPMHWVLAGGEDYALVAAFPSARSVPSGWSVIGLVDTGSGVLVDGQPYEHPDAGWQHWR